MTRGHAERGISESRGGKPSRYTPSKSRDLRPALPAHACGIEPRRDPASGCRDPASLRDFARTLRHSRSRHAGHIRGVIRGHGAGPARRSSLELGRSGWPGAAPRRLPGRWVFRPGCSEPLLVCAPDTPVDRRSCPAWATWPVT